VEQVIDTKVRDTSVLEEVDATEEEDDEWHFAVDCGKRLIPDPAADLRPI
jgi:hypothetical protein